MIGDQLIYLEAPPFTDTSSAGGAYVKSTCARGASAVEHSGMHSQSFRISKVKLFGTGLETGIGAG